MLKKILWIICWLVVLCMLLMFCFTFGLWQHWSTLSILGLWLVMILLAVLLWSAQTWIRYIIHNKIWYRWFARYRLSRKEYLLRHYWKQGASLIRQSRRGRQYQPWFILTGERCGKSTLLAHSGIPCFERSSSKDTVTPTHSLNWWFFHHLGILELSSRFLTSGDRFNQGWQKLVRCCVRQLPAPAGIIIALPVKILLSNDKVALEKMARRQRELIDPLLRGYDASLPIYIMITQCDQIPGFSYWMSRLSPQQRQQMLGYTWETPPRIDGQDPSMLCPLFASLTRGISLTQISMLKEAHVNTADYHLLLDLSRIIAGFEFRLRAVLSGVCEPNAWFRHGTLRSIWFSASLPQQKHPGRRDSFFIQDLLTQYLPEQRSVSRVHLSRRKCIITGVLGILFTSWLIISAGATALRIPANIEQLSRDTLVYWLTKEEQSPPGLLYLPYKPLFSQQYKKAHARLLLVSKTTGDVEKVMSDYRQRTLAATPANKRAYILQLADALLVWKKMREGATLQALSPLGIVSSELGPIHYSESISARHKLILERHFMQQRSGVEWDNAARALLISLVTDSPVRAWLTAPGDGLLPVESDEFWPSLGKKYLLPGHLTKTGDAKIRQWINQLEQAAGQRLPSLTQSNLTDVQNRQLSWQKYLTEVVVNLPVMATRLSHSSLIEMSQNKGPGMRFANRILKELEDIPDDQRQPWLATLHQIGTLSADIDSASWRQKLLVADEHLRRNVTSWLRYKNFAWVNTEQGSASRAWNQWQEARNKVIKTTLSSEQPGPALARHLLAPSDNETQPSPLGMLLPAMTQLREYITPENNDPGIEAVWRLYHYDARALLNNALAHAACWLNTQWQSNVTGVLERSTYTNEHQAQINLSHQLIENFLRGPARSFLALGVTGPVAASYAGFTVPLNPVFLHLINTPHGIETIQPLSQRTTTQDEDKRVMLTSQRQQLIEARASLEQQPVIVTADTLPVTVPAGTPLNPTGYRLTLYCNNNAQQLTSVNLAERLHFRWHPGRCNQVTLYVLFPGFEVGYRLDGHDAWPRFIGRIATGELLLTTADFGSDASALHQAGISQILVRLKLSDPETLLAVWQRWQQYTQKITDAETRLSNLTKKISSQQHQLKHSGPLSLLPENIAMCK